VQREALVLVALILTVDAGFVAAYFLTQIRNGLIPASWRLPPCGLLSRWQL
jgi:hypothetical protein